MIFLGLLGSFFLLPKNIALFGSLEIFMIYLGALG
jgi:hypothetical protein